MCKMSNNHISSDSLTTHDYIKMFWFADSSLFKVKMARHHSQSDVGPNIVTPCVCCDWKTYADIPVAVLWMLVCFVMHIDGQIKYHGLI